MSNEFRAAAMDAVREIDKLITVLEAVDRMMRAEAEMNAAKHMSSEVHPNPLAAAVRAGLVGAKSKREQLFRAANGEFPMVFGGERVEVEE